MSFGSPYKGRRTAQQAPLLAHASLHSLHSFFTFFTYPRNQTQLHHRLTVSGGETRCARPIRAHSASVRCDRPIKLQQLLEQSILPAARDSAYSCLLATCKAWPGTAVLPSLLSGAGASVSVFSPGPYLHLSSHLDERIKGYRDPKRAAAELLKLLEHRHFDWVIVADDDLLRALLETSDRAKLAPWFPFDPFGDAGRLLTSKFGFAAEAARAGIPAPESTLAESVPIVAAYASVFGYPVVLKGDRGFAGLEVDVVWDEETLRVKSAVHLARY